MKKVLKHYFVPHSGNEYHPHIFRPKSVVLTSGLAVGLFVLALGYSTLIGGWSFLASVLPSVLIDGANENRSLYNLSPLTRNAILEEAAQEKANDMAKYSYFSHNSPTGITPWYWFTKAGYKFIYAGENLAINFTDSSAVTQAWMNSPGHRANILNGNFTEIGIATAEGTYEGHPTTFVVQLFGRPIVAQNTSPLSTPIAAASEKQSNPEKITEKVIVPSVKPVVTENKFVAVENTEVSETQKNAIIPQNEPTTQYSSLPNKIITSPNSMLDIVYFAIALVLIIAILISLGVELRRHHGKHLVSGVAVLLLLIVLAYLYSGVSGLPVAVV